MQWGVVIQFSLAYTGLFLVGFCLILAVGVLGAPGAMSHDYPEPIRERYGPKTRRDHVVTVIMSVLMAVLILGTPIVAMVVLNGALGGGVGLLDGMVVGAIVFVLMNIFDLVVIDWLLFCTVQPKAMVLPGTEGMPEYRDYAFHWKVLVPSPIPWPLLLIPGFGIYCGILAAVVGGIG